MCYNINPSSLCPCQGEHEHSSLSSPNFHAYECLCIKYDIQMTAEYITAKTDFHIKWYSGFSGEWLYDWRMMVHSYVCTRALTPQCEAFAFDHFAIIVPFKITGMCYLCTFTIFISWYLFTLCVLWGVKTNPRENIKGNKNAIKVVVIILVKVFFDNQATLTHLIQTTEKINVWIIIHPPCLLCMFAFICQWNSVRNCDQIQFWDFCWV